MQIEKSKRSFPSRRKKAIRAILILGGILAIFSVCVASFFLIAIWNDRNHPIERWETINWLNQTSSETALITGDSLIWDTEPWTVADGAQPCVYGGKWQYYRTYRPFAEVIKDYQSVFTELGWKHTIDSWGIDEEKREFDVFYDKKQFKFISVSDRSPSPFSLQTDYVISFRHHTCTLHDLP